MSEREAEAVDDGGAGAPCLQGEGEGARGRRRQGGGARVRGGP
jgi:hypothetical protein